MGTLDAMPPKASAELRQSTPESLTRNIARLRKMCLKKYFRLDKLAVPCGVLVSIVSKPGVKDRSPSMSSAPAACEKSAIHAGFYHRLLVNRPNRESRFAIIAPSRVQARRGSLTKWR